VVTEVVVTVTAQALETKGPGTEDTVGAVFGQNHYKKMMEGEGDKHWSVFSYMIVVITVTTVTQRGNAGFPR
jgi:hypothetical protein